jgi:hypothetical protein
VKRFSCGDLLHHHHHHHLHIGHMIVYNDLAQMNMLRNMVSVEYTSLDLNLA